MSAHAQNGISSKHCCASAAHPIVSQQTNVVGRRRTLSPPPPRHEAVVFVNSKGPRKAERRCWPRRFQRADLAPEVLRQPDIVCVEWRNIVASPFREPAIASGRNAAVRLVRQANRDVAAALNRGRAEG